jgi:hypothetical protein
MKILSSKKGIAILLLLVAVGLFANLLVYWVSPTGKAQYPTSPERYEVNVIPLANAGAGCARAGDNTCSLFALIDPSHIVSSYSINFCYMAVPGGSSDGDALEVRCAPGYVVVNYSR